jgi:hypothetical protein
VNDVKVKDLLPRQKKNEEVEMKKYINKFSRTEANSSHCVLKMNACGVGLLSERNFQLNFKSR